MKCSVCGYEFEDGKLRCPLCGTRAHRPAVPEINFTSASEAFDVKRDAAEESEPSWNTYDFPKPRNFRDITMRWPTFNAPSEHGRDPEAVAAAEQSWAEAEALANQQAARMAEERAEAARREAAKKEAEAARIAAERAAAEKAEAAAQEAQRAAEKSALEAQLHFAKDDVSEPAPRESRKGIFEESDQHIPSFDAIFKSHSGDASLEQTVSGFETVTPEDEILSEIAASSRSEEPVSGIKDEAAAEDYRAQYSALVASQKEEEEKAAPETEEKPAAEEIWPEEDDDKIPTVEDILREGTESAKAGEDEELPPDMDWLRQQITTSVYGMDESYDDARRTFSSESWMPESTADRAEETAVPAEPSGTESEISEAEVQKDAETAPEEPVYEAGSESAAEPSAEAASLETEQAAQEASAEEKSASEEASAETASVPAETEPEETVDYIWNAPEKTETKPADDTEFVDFTGYTEKAGFESRRQEEPEFEGFVKHTPEEIAAAKAEEEARKAAEEARLAEEKAAEEEAARIAAEEAERKAEEARIAAEEQAQKEAEEAARKAEEARLAEEKAAEEAKLAEEEAARVAAEEAERKAEEARIAAEEQAQKAAEEAARKAAEEARIAEEKAAEEARLAAEKAAEDAKLTAEEAAQKAEEAAGAVSEKAEDIISNPINEYGYHSVPIKEGEEKRPEKFFTFTKKNEEFQQLLNQEYERIRRLNNTLDGKEDDTPLPQQKPQPAPVEEAASGLEGIFGEKAQEKPDVKTQIFSKPEEKAPKQEEVISRPSSNPNVIPAETAVFTEVSSAMGSDAFRKQTVETKIAEMKAAEEAEAKYRSERRKRLEEMQRARENYFAKQDAAKEQKEAATRDTVKAKGLSETDEEAAKLANGAKEEDKTQTGTALESKQQTKEFDNTELGKEIEPDEFEYEPRHKHPLLKFFAVLVILLGLGEGAVIGMRFFIPDSPATETATQIEQAFVDAGSTAYSAVKKQIDKLIGLVKPKTGQEPEVVDIQDGMDFPAVAASVNKNIKSVWRNPELVYSDAIETEIEGLADATVVDDLAVKEAVYKTMIGYNSSWVDYANNSDETVLGYLKADRAAYRSAVSYARKGQVEESFEELQLGEIRDYGEGVYIFVKELISLKDGQNVSSANFNWIYDLEKVGDEYKIVNYKSFK
ncbi:MAG: hypothetical protein IJM08_04250 [Firmicutes bacterium]|nr:hypothetical protein [Bacillota bacterium]